MGLLYSWKFVLKSLILPFTLIKYFDATEEELAAFENALEDPRNDWTCDFEDELLPIFLEVRKQLNNK